jgi:RiboL-PSP-HEPN
MDSFRQFEDRISEIDCLINLIPDKPTSDNVKTIDSLCRASIVLLCSHLEGFLQDLMEEIIDEINSLTIGFKELPIELYIQHAFPKGKLNTNTFDGIFNFIQEVKSLENSNIPIELNKRNFSNTESNPTPDVINKLFKLIGEENVLDKLNSEILELETQEVVVPFFNEEERNYLTGNLGQPTIIDYIDKYLSSKRNKTKRKDRNVGFYNKINTLLTYRNNIAHGNIGLRISNVDVIELKEATITLVQGLSEKAERRLETLKELTANAEELSVGQ